MATEYQSSKDVECVRQANKLMRTVRDNLIEYNVELRNGSPELEQKTRRIREEVSRLSQLLGDANSDLYDIKWGIENARI